MKKSILLIRNKNNFNPDPEKNDKLCWKKGDPIAAFPINKTFTRNEGLPNFLKIEITNAGPEEVQKLFIKNYETSPVRIDTGINIIQKRKDVLLRSKYKFDINLLTASMRTRLLNSGCIKLKLNTLKKYMVNKTNNKTFNREE